MFFYILIFIYAFARGNWMRYMSSGNKKIQAVTEVLAWNLIIFIIHYYQNSNNVEDKTYFHDQTIKFLTVESLFILVTFVFFGGDLCNSSLSMTPTFHLAAFILAQVSSNFHGFIPVLILGLFSGLFHNEKQQNNKKLSPVLVFGGLFFMFTLQENYLACTAISVAIWSHLVSIDASKWTSHTSKVGPLVFGLLYLYEQKQKQNNDTQDNNTNNTNGDLIINVGIFASLFVICINMHNSVPTQDQVRSLRNNNNNNNQEIETETKSVWWLKDYKSGNLLSMVSVGILIWIGFINWYFFSSTNTNNNNNNGERGGISRLHKNGLFITNALAVVSLLRTKHTDPGSVPKKPDADRSFVFARGIKKCKHCETRKPSTAHHCSKAGRCVIDLDHACPWTGNSIGLRNRKYFIQFVGYTATTCLLGGLACYFTWVHENNTRNKIDDVLEAVLVATFIFSIVFGFFTCAMFKEQMRSIMRNTPKIDELQNKRGIARPFLVSLAEIMGPPGVQWLLPVMSDSVEKLYQTRINNRE